MGRLEDLDVSDAAAWEHSKQPEQRVPRVEAPQEEPQPGPLQIRGYSITGVELRGWEVAVYAESGINEGRWRSLRNFQPSKKGADKAAKFAESEYKRLGGIIRIRPIISVDPTTLQGDANG